MSMFLALYALTLPNTPPKGMLVSGENTNSFSLLPLFKNFSFVVFVLCVFLASIPAYNYFNAAQATFLTQRGYPSPVALSTINQFSTMLLMLALPFCIARFGLKNVLLIGMAAWAVRYFCFAEPYFALTVVGLLLHGFCYSFLYVAAYMYAEKVAPVNLKATVQSMMVFLLLGVGQILGGFAYGKMYDWHSPKFSSIGVTQDRLDNVVGDLPGEMTDTVKVQIPAWNLYEEVSTVRTIDLGKLLDGKPLTVESINAMERLQLIQDGVRISQMETCCGGDATFKAVTATVRYTKDDMKNLCRAIATCSHCGTVPDDFSLTREDWLAAQSADWKTIFHTPAIFIMICFVLFLLLGRDHSPISRYNGES
jgi:hypothetical protein